MYRFHCKRSTCDKLGFAQKYDDGNRTVRDFRRYCQFEIFKARGTFSETRPRRQKEKAKKLLDILCFKLKIKNS